MLKKFINQRNVKKYEYLLKKIQQQFLSFSDDIDVSLELKNLKEDKSISPEIKTIKAMALAKKAAFKVLSMTYYDVQLIGALAMVDGAMVEMKTGEGKTLTCSAVVAANYVLGYQTHVATANEYLAKRDQETLKNLYNHMGITSNFNISTMNKEEKRIAYESNVVYSTAQEFGFDFLRDNLVYDSKEKVQPRYFDNIKCIIDEADFVLIDEARTPLIISGEAPVREYSIYQSLKSIAHSFSKIDEDPNQISQFEPSLELGDFWIDEKQKNVYLSEKGYLKLELESKKSGILVESKHINDASSLYDENNSWIINEALNALRSQYLYHRDKDYVIKDDQIVIVDPNTGRLSEGRTWSNGLHQAIEAKENLRINPENTTLGSISIQNYFRHYYQISGMSGTIMQSTQEFEDIYQCKTIQIATNKPVVRVDHQDKIYIQAHYKYQSIIEDVLKRHENGQPILIGTTSVAESEIISQLLEKKALKHYVLNAKNNAFEAQLIAQAGEPYRITVATSMAGRGTDIILGGNKESLQHILNEQSNKLQERFAFAHHITSQLDIEETILLESYSNEIKLDVATNEQKLSTLYQDNFAEQLEHNCSFIWNYLYQLQHSIKYQLSLLETQWNHWKKQVIDVGGLCVIGSSRNDSRRIDDQLKGRSGRQGDPGECVFYMSFEDPWINAFGQSSVLKHLIQSLPAEQLISSPTITKVFTKAQNSIESHHFNIRKNTYQYDSITDEGRRQFLSLRNNLLFDNETIKNMMTDKLMHDFSILMSEDFLSYMEEQHHLTKMTPQKMLDYSLDEIYQFIYSYQESEFFAYYKKPSHIDEQLLLNYIDNIFVKQNSVIWGDLTKEILSHLDKHWSHHLDIIDEAQRNVSFSALAQKNPIYEYKKICFQSFSHMVDNLKQKMLHDFIEKSELKTISA